ncbi:MAG: double-strand break repair protein AddB, partial [Proteobacteria bacterium]|nr:double-strand break repair protein AddB [Pseudomonadota bacterium]
MRRPRAEAPSKKVYTIPAGVAFLDAIARRVLDEAGSDPLALCRVTILLPTRRACRALQESFLRLSRRDALLLPLMRPLGDLDDEGPEAADWPEGAHELPPAIGPLRRRLLLTRLILRWAKARGQDHLSADQAARLSGELARLLDQVETERLSFDGLSGLVPDDYATHWQITLDFLELVTEHWPAILDELGLMDPALRRNRALEALAAAWRRQPPDEPVIAAGSTGSIPATADLLASVAELPRGAVVLPGLDGTLAQAEWQALEPSHPQSGLTKLLERLGVERGDVQAWPTGA